MTLDDPAVDVMTDFRKVRAITVPESVSMQYASQRMRANGVHLLLVSDDRNIILGLVTSNDIDGQKAITLINEHRLRRDEIRVRDIMTGRERLEVIDMADVRRARVGHVVATLMTAGRQHAMVVDRDEAGHQVVRGLFAASQLNRQLGMVIDTIGIVRSFADAEQALAHA